MGSVHVPTAAAFRRSMAIGWAADVASATWWPISCLSCCGGGGGGGEWFGLYGGILGLNRGGGCRSRARGIGGMFTSGGGGMFTGSANVIVCGATGLSAARAGNGVLLFSDAASFLMTCLPA